MAVRGIYATVNGTRRQYPCVEVDLAAIAAAGSLGQLSATSYTGGTPAQFLTVRTIPVSTYLSETISDPRSEDQIVYFPEDNLMDCFEEVTLDTEPDDFWLHGIPSPSSPRSVNSRWYSSVLDSGTGRHTMYLSQNAFTPATYLYNDSCCRVVQTDTDYAFGLAWNAVYSPASGFNYYQFDAWFLWYNNIYGLDESMFNLQIQYGLQSPRLDVAQSNRTYRIWNNIDMSGSNPPTPADFICCFCVGEYDGVTYVGWIYYYIDSDGSPTDVMSFDMFPLWYWGEDALQPYEPPSPPIPDPSDYGPDSEPDAGGNGTYTDTNTAPVLPPEFSFVDELGANGIHLYQINSANYGALIDALWGQGTLSSALWQRWENYKFNPIQGIISSHYIPYELLPDLESTTSVHMAGVDMAPSVSAAPCKTQISTYTVGSLSIPEFFGTALDYSPYTVMRLFLPFCGWIEIDPDRVVGGSLTVQYRCDCISGDVCAYVLCTDRTGSNTYMYTATGNCAITLPITGNDQGTGQTLSALSGIVMGAVAGNPLGIASGAIGLLSAQHHMQQTGSFAGSISQISDLTCRLQIIRPVQSTPKYGQELRGRPSDVGCLIGDLIGTGWSSFSAVHADIEGATVDECREIERLLHEGVIL